MKTRLARNSAIIYYYIYYNYIGTARLLDVYICFNILGYMI